MPTVTELLIKSRELREMSERAESYGLRLISNGLRDHSLYAHLEACRSARFWYVSGEARVIYNVGRSTSADPRKCYPIDPERESEWFANFYGLSDSLHRIERIEIDPEYRSLGKFDDQLSEIVWGWSLESGEPIYSDPDLGESAYSVRFDLDDLISVSGLLAEPGLWSSLGRRLPYGAIVWEDSRGFVSVDFYSSSEALEAESDAIRARIESALDDECSERGCDPCPACSGLDCGSCSGKGSGSTHVAGCSRDWIG